jgi:hypothetical protein
MQQRVTTSQVGHGVDTSQVGHGGGELMDTSQVCHDVQAGTATCSELLPM